MLRRFASTLCVFAFLSIAAEPARADIITFEDLKLSSPNSYENGSGLVPAGSFQSGVATFNNDYSKSFDAWSGWSFSNVKNTTTPGFGNQYAAFAPGGGDGSDKYGVAFAYNQGDATIIVPPGQAPTSMRVTNTTYTALTLRDGDPFSKKFGGASGNDADFFLLTIIGQNALGQATGTIGFYLADYRFADNSKDYIVSDWTTVDLTSLGSDTTQLSFGLSSSDVGPFGMNTPAYFAMDNLTVAAIPEPSSLALVAIAGCGLAWRRRMASRDKASRAEPRQRSGDSAPWRKHHRRPGTPPHPRPSPARGEGS